MYDTTGDYVFQNCSLQLPSEATSNERTSNNGGGDNKNSSIGLSMIKTWLRNQPAPTQQDTNNKNNGGAQSLSLSMSTGSQSAASALPLLAVNGGVNNTGGDQSSSDNNKQQKSTTPSLDSQTGAVESVPRKSIDTFGQRTSIYRGVTRYLCTNH
jgi:AP2-like factor (ANT lineage)